MVRVDSKGRIVLPKELRERLNITPGTEVELVEDDGAIRVERERDPGDILERMERLIEEASVERERESDPTGRDATHPIAEKHRRTVERGASPDDGDSSPSDGGGDRTAGPSENG
ncbi:AbrB/MazE/SpoVT family DNA-binding domain-containing protein [Halosimplex marinum]|uniref:AbrB/MazE/SpoVT family DNA-binding domain-containing protein n=1 Tax=Halosimplex marinum TaxID=3396620 RepID=UPI003F5490D2